MKKILLMLCCCAVTAAFAVEWNMADVSIVMPKKVTPNLERAKKVIVAEGITTIGSFAFYNPYAEQEVEFVLPDSLKIIECYGIGVPTNNLHVGKNLEQIREEGIDYSKVRGTIYLPKTLNLIGKLAWDKEFCYEGTLEEFYKINTVFWGEVVSMEDFLNRYTDRKRVFLYINAEDINDKHQFWR